MRRQIMFTALLALLLLMAGPGPALAADTVQVTLPSFSVTLNGQTNGNVNVNVCGGGGFAPPPHTTQQILPSKSSL